MIPAPLLLLLALLTRLQAGHSVYAALKYAINHQKDRFTDDLVIWLNRYENGKRGEELLSGLEELKKTPARTSLLQILEAGLIGSPIAQPLKVLRSEFLYRCEMSYEKQLQILPLLLLIPLLLGFFPAVLILLLGPALFLITTQLGGG